MLLYILLSIRVCITNHYEWHIVVIMVSFKKLHNIKNVNNSSISRPSYPFDPP